MGMKQKQDNWKKVDSLVQAWAAPGEELVGTLIAKEQSAQYNNLVYKVQNDEGDVITLFGTAVLNKRLGFVTLGTRIKIIYLGTEPAKKPGMNDTKLFDVFVEE